MSEFKGFSPAAKLYAENFDIVGEMRRGYRVEVLAFLAVLEEKIHELVAPERFNSYETPAGNRYWWLGPTARGQSPYLWFKNDPSELDHTGMVVTGGTDSPDEAPLRALVDLAASSALALVPTEPATRYNAFTVSVDFLGDSFIAPLAARMTEILKAMHAAHLGILGSTKAG